MSLIQRLIKAFNQPSIPLTPKISMKQRVMNRNEAFKHWSGIAINRRAESAGNVEPIIKRNGEIVEGTWLQELIEQPTNYLTWIDFIELISMWLDLDGNAYIYVPKSQLYKGKPAILDVFPSDKMKMQIGTKKIEKYLYNDGGVNLTIEPEDIIHIKTLMPSGDYAYSNLIGSPRNLISVAGAILTETEKHEFMQEHYSRRAISPYILIQGDDYSDPQAVADMLKDKLPRNYQPLTILPQHYSLEPIKSDAAAQNSVSSAIEKGILIDEICAAFGTPKSFLTMEYNARATAEVSEISFYQKAVKNILTRIYSSLNNYLFKYDDLYLDFEIPDYNDYSLKVDTTIKLFQSGIIDLATAQSELGYEIQVNEVKKKALRIITGRNGN